VALVGTRRALVGIQRLPLPNSRFNYFTSMGLWVTRSSTGFATNYSSISFQPVITGSTIYVDGINGNNANAGTNPALPRKTISGVNSLSASLVHQYLVKGNSLTPYRVTAGIQITRSCVVSSWDGGRIVVANTLNANPETWSATAGQPGVYQSALASSPYSVVDIAFVDGGTSDAPRYRVYPVLGSVAAVQAAPGSWYWDGTNLYVQTSDSRAPDAKVLPTNGTQSYTWVPGATVALPVFWQDQIDVVGGYDAFLLTEQTGSGGDGGNTALRAYINRSTGQACRDQGLHFLTIGNTLCYNCGGYNTLDDGFHYDGLNAASNTDPAGNHVNINPSAYNCGASPSTQANSYSQHSLSTAVVVNPNFSMAWNRDLANINSSYMWMLGGAIGPSRQATGTTSISLQAGTNTSDTTVIYADGTTIRSGSQYDLSATQGSAILFRGGNPGYTVSPVSLGTIGSYY